MEDRPSSSKRKRVRSEKALVINEVEKPKKNESGFMGHNGVLGTDIMRCAKCKSRQNV